MPEAFDHEDELQARIAWYYYHDNITQGDIGRMFNLPRIKVSRILEKARESGMVEVRIHSPYQSCLSLEQSLRARFALKEVRVIPSGAPGDITARLGNAAALFLMQHLSRGDSLAVGWGVTVSETIRRLSHLGSALDIALVSLTGGVSSYLNGMRKAQWESDVFFIPAPLMVSDERTAQALLQESAIRTVMDMGQAAVYKLVGIGELQDDATIVRGGFIHATDVEPLRRRGVVGDILCRFFDARGQELDLPLHRRVIAPSLSELKTHGNIIAVAGGAGKVNAIRAALCGALPHILITDQQTAEALLEEET